MFAAPYVFAVNALGLNLEVVFWFGVFQSFMDRYGHSNINGPRWTGYFITTPQFQTASEKYGWLNKLQGVGKMAEYKRTKDDSYVNYDIFGLR